MKPRDPSVEEMALLAERLDALEAALCAQSDTASHREKELRRLRAELRDMQNSLSWTVTAPLRRLAKLGRNILRARPDT
jgi:uncharacterized coiled-coil protein SlyX